MYGWDCNVTAPQKRVYFLLTNMRIYESEYNYYTSLFCCISVNTILIVSMSVLIKVSPSKVFNHN